MTRAQVISLLERVAGDTPAALVRQAQETLWQLEPTEGSDAADVLDAVDSLLSDALLVLTEGPA